MSKLIIDISDSLHKDLKSMALELDTTLKVLVQSMLFVDDESIFETKDNVT